MLMYKYNESAICPKCGSEQSYEIVEARCSFDPLPSNNKCRTCGNQLTRNDIVLDKCSREYHWILEAESEYEKALKESESEN